MKAEQAKNMFIAVAKKILASEDFLTEIDNQIGDGDHGIGMATGFRQIKKELESKNFLYVNEVFHTIGMAMLESMGGASGVLFGTVFISGIVGMEQKKEFHISDFSSVFTKSLEALKKRGGAQVGDKTMIDALEPAVLSLQKAVKEGKDIKEGFCLAAGAAEEGVEYTKHCIAKFGRAKYYKEKALGYQDAGATSVFLIFDAMCNWAENNL